MYIPEIETKNPSEIKIFQETKLQETLKYLSENSKYYLHIFRTHNIDIEKIDLEQEQIIGLSRVDFTIGFRFGY